MRASFTPIYASRGLIACGAPKGPSGVALGHLGPHPPAPSRLPGHRPARDPPVPASPPAAPQNHTGLRQNKSLRPCQRAWCPLGGAGAQAEEKLPADSVVRGAVEDPRPRPSLVGQVARPPTAGLSEFCVDLGREVRPDGGNPLGC